MTIHLKVDTRIESEANLREHWTKAHKRHTAQKWHVHAALVPFSSQVELPCSIELKRISPRSLDDDNLATAFKYVRDTIAAILLNDFRPGRADNDPRITWQYTQQRGAPKQYSFEILIRGKCDAPENQPSQ